MRQSSRTLREAMTKKGRCRVFGNGPLTFPRLLDVVADAAIVARARDTGPRFPEVPAGSMRQIPEPPSTPPLSHKETAGRCVDATWRGRPVLILPHTSGFSHRCGRSTVKTIRLTRLSRLIISRFRNNI